MTIKKLYITVGPPGSGKSSYIKNQSNLKNSVIVSRDAIRFSLIQKDENYFSKEKQVFNEFCKQIAMALNSPEIESVWADATHITIASREKVLNKVNKLLNYSLAKIEIILIVFDTPLSVCLFRNSKRLGRERVPDQAIINMYNKFEKPSFKEKYKYAKISVEGQNE